MRKSTVSGFDLALCLPSASVSSALMVLKKFSIYIYILYILNFFLFTSSLPFSELSLVGLALDLVD